MSSSGYARFQSRLPSIELRSSALLRAAIAEDRFHVTDYLGDGEYPHHRDEKDEVEAFVAQVHQMLRTESADDFAHELRHYLRAMFPSDQRDDARATGAMDRLVAFAALQRTVDDALHELDDASFEAPSLDDPAFVCCPELFQRLDKDGLLVLCPEDVSDERLRSEGVLRHGALALYPHPMLAPMRELVGELFDLVGQPGLTVSLALHPFRVTDAREVPMRLLEDYWSGIQVTVENLDSLDPHDIGVRTFHAARQETPQRFFFPLLGTWFDWERRSRHDATDPVKRLYIREVCPATDRRGEPLVAAKNRELHAERDTAERCFTHVDGKICRYATARYKPSAQHPNADPGKPTCSRKLWRVDGPLSDAQWRLLVGLHFRGNELIEEHFAEAFPGPDVEISSD